MSTPRFTASPCPENCSTRGEMARTDASRSLHEAAGCDQVMIMMQTETIPHEKMMKSLELFGKYVIPEFKQFEERAVNPGA